MNKLFIEFEIDNPKLISVNDQYIHPVRKTKNGRYLSYFAPSPYLKEVKAFYEEILKDKISDEDIIKIQDFIASSDKIYGLSLEIIYGIPLKSIRNDDASNYIKSLEDCIVRRTGVDDSIHYKVSAEKRIFESDDNHWIIRILIRSHELVNYLN